MEHFNANEYRFLADRAVRHAEQLAAGAQHTLSHMKDPQLSMLQSSTGSQAVAPVGPRSQPVGEELTRPASGQLPLNDRKRELVEDNVMAQLRAAAKIDCRGQFAEGPRHSLSRRRPLRCWSNSQHRGRPSTTDIIKAIRRK